MDAFTILVRARKLINRRWKWGQGQRMRATIFGIRYCATSAVDVAIYELAYDGPYTLRDEALKYLRLAISDDANLSVVTWNDARHRKYIEVRNAFDKAIELARQDFRN